MPIAATKAGMRSVRRSWIEDTEQIPIKHEEKFDVNFSTPYRDRVELAESLFGILPATITFEEAREEKLLEL